ncbi:UDP-N-acetylmuramoyl-tripeptide--D-alanyl-D-alanine ligase [Anaerotignum propionicum]|uniref:UDP-N-acetylmuramoyl-tripeptide--D-alanyl-D- alanine ligase n=1 Tax=Anaerotignum propionicum TaxID=28446 RepID=UPI0028A2BFA5|nr:UDP-N-acetylmuramoyl-tripeptide--D-alanyl-D-alanine ligase [Anaerotignum propionicum]MEA5058282.1 UDP-N-acetylmuramoyl-tripeptide--D-alanyl-D-alanine ligase [Anaerotignum propionicum]
MKKMTIGEIIEATNAQVIAVDGLDEVLNKTISHITQNSKEVTKDSLFFAVQGERVDGHQFIEECFEKGIAACLSCKVIAPKKGGVLLLVPDVKKALLKLAAHYRNKFNIPFIGITGSVGKTTTKDMVASVLSQKYDILWTQGNYNNDIGVPLTLFRLEDHHEIAVIEMGMNHFGEIHALAEVVRPQLGLISNVGVAHIEYLGSREGILKAKCEMFDFMPEDGVAVLNGDNDMLSTLEGKLPQRLRWFGIDNKKDIYADHLELMGMEKTKCTIHTPVGSLDTIIPMPGEHMVLNALSAVTVGLEMGLSFAEIKEGIENFVPTKNRMNIMKLENGITVLNDVYNANPVSVKASLNILANADGRKVAILGFMGELGEYASQMHEEVGVYAAEKGIDLLFCIGKFNVEMEQGARDGGLKAVYCFASQEDFWNEGLALLKNGDAVLVKASRSMALEKTVEKIQGVN